MKHKVLTLLYIFTLTLLGVSVIACSDPRTYNQYKSVSLQGWTRNDTLTFDIPRQWEGNYQLDLCLRATHAFPYRFITMIVERKVINFKHGRKKEKQYNDTINCEIINNKGLLKGLEAITRTDIQQPICNFPLNRNDSLRIKVYHIMNRESLPGLSDIGLRLTKPLSFNPL